MVAPSTQKHTKPMCLLKKLKGEVNEHHTPEFFFIKSVIAVAQLTKTPEKGSERVI